MSQPLHPGTEALLRDEHMSLQFAKSPICTEIYQRNSRDTRLSRESVFNGNAENDSVTTTVGASVLHFFFAS